jgi:hypothetical protein
MSRKADKSQLRVRVGENYNARLNTHHGQRNVELTVGPLETPLSRFGRRFSRFGNHFARLGERFDSIALLEPGYNLIHSFNAVPILTTCPFILTFEDYAPRMPEDRPIPWLEKYLVRPAPAAVHRHSRNV